MRWKWILGIFAAVILVLLITVFIIVASYDFNKFKPQIATITKKHTGRNLTISGDIGLGINLHPTLVLDDVAFQNAPWGSRPNMVTVKHIEIQVDLLPLIQGDFRVENLRLIKPDLLIEVNKTGQNNLQFEVSKKPVADAPKEKTGKEPLDFLGLKDITLKDGTVAFYDHRNKTKHVLIVKEHVRKAAGFKTESDINFVGSYNNYPFKVRGRIGALANIIDPSQKWDLDLSAEAFESNFTFSGSILDVVNARGIDLKLTAKGDDLAKFEKLAQKPLPVNGPYSFSGRLEAANLKKLKVSDIEIQMGQSHLAGEVALNLKSTRPQIDARLHSKKLDFQPYMQNDKRPEKSKTKPDTGNSRKGKVFSDQAFDFQPLQYVDAKMEVRVDQILGPQIPWDNLRVNLDLNSGQLVVNPLSAGLGGGKLSASLELRTQRSHADLKTKINIEKADLKSLIKGFGVSGTFEGTLDFGITLEGQGESLAALMAGLNGDVIIILGESEVPIEYLNFLGNIIGGDFTANLNKMLNPYAEKIDRTQINCAVCDFNIKDGLAESDVIIVDDPRKTLLSKGKIDLKTEKLDFGIFTEPKEGIGTKGTGKVSVSLSKITRPFKLGGTLANPVLGIDPARTATTVGAAFLGPVGWAYLLVSVKPGDENPCMKALEMAGEGKAKEKGKPAEEKDQKSKTKTGSEGIGSKLKRLFSKPKN